MIEMSGIANQPNGGWKMLYRIIGTALPVNSLNDDGIDLRSFAQKTPDFFAWYKPGSIIIVFAPMSLDQSWNNLDNNVHIQRDICENSDAMRRVGLLFPTKITRVLNEVQIPWQEGEYMQKIWNTNI